MIEFFEKSDIFQVRIFHDLIEGLERHRRYIGAIKNFHPFRGGFLFQALGADAEIFRGVLEARRDAIEARIGFEFRFTDGVEHRKSLAVGIGGNTDPAVPGRQRP